MFYVDLMGNLLSNLKLAFYEYKDEKNFISKMYQESYENGHREILIKAYQIILFLLELIYLKILLIQPLGMI